MDFKGIIIKVFPIKSGVSKTSGKEWTSQDYLIEEFKQQHCQSIVFNVFGKERIDKFQLQEWQMVTVSLDFKAKEWNEKYFNGVTCYNVVHDELNAVQSSQTNVTNSNTQQPVAQPATDPQSAQDNNMGLPF